MSNQIPVSERLSAKCFIPPASYSAGTVKSAWANVSLAAWLRVTAIVGTVASGGTVDVQLNQAYLNQTAQGVVTTASAIATATALLVSGGTYAVNDVVSPDGGITWVTVTSALVGAGSLAVTALPNAVASGASILALTGVNLVASLSGGLNGHAVPEAPFNNDPGLVTTTSINYLDTRGIDLNGNYPTPTDGTAVGNNGARYVSVSLITAVAASSVAVLLESANERGPAFQLDDVAAGTVSRVFA